MENRIYKESFTLRYRDVNMNGRWRTDSILYCMQEASERHAEILGCSRSVLLEHGAVWVLSRTHLVMDRYPGPLETVEITTWPAGGNRFMLNRHYLFHDDKGNEIGRATSIWVLLDIRERKALPANALPITLPDNSDIPAPLPTPRKLRSPASETLSSQPLTPHYQDYDVNGHVNNTRCAVWFSDIPTNEYHADHVLRELQINYNQEILPGASVTLEYGWQDDTLVCQGSGPDASYFQAQGIFISIQE